MKRHHVIISGTGRTGTTLLIQLLTKLGLDTGFTGDDDHVYQTCNAGMEHSLTAEKVPYIIKNPDFCKTLEKALVTGNYRIDHTFIPVRDLFSAARSRIKVSEETPRYAIPKGLSRAPGGLWGTKDKSQQEDILVRKFFQLIYVIVRYDIPHTFLEFPRLALDPAYTYEKLKPILKDVGYDEFAEIFQETSKPERINDFAAKSVEQKYSASASPLRSLGRRIFRNFNRT
jgi:hypothetical protein